MTDRFPRALASSLLVAVWSYSAIARGQSSRGTSVLPIFSIAKSENKNQVQYVVRIDDRCAPVGPSPVSGYWRMLERGRTQTAPLLPRELRPYGLASQQLLVSDDATGGRVRATLNALPARPLTIVTWRGGDGACHAVAEVSIAGTSAHLFNVYVRLKWDGVDYVLLQGWSIDGSHVVRETLTK
jgi:hypothetical protein